MSRCTLEWIIWMAAMVVFATLALSGRWNELGIALVITVVALLMSTQLHAGASYLQIFVILVLLGAGSGTALVPLTQAGLAGVAPADAGAASGLVNVVQQLGSTIGIGVLVTVFAAASEGTGAKALIEGVPSTIAVSAGLIALALVVALALMRPLSLAGLFGGITGCVIGFINVLRIFWMREPTAKTYQTMAVGAAESLVPVFVGFACLTVAWLLVDPTRRLEAAPAVLLDDRRSRSA